jgi:hypothetical protein
MLLQQVGLETTRGWGWVGWGGRRGLRWFIVREVLPLAAGQCKHQSAIKT